MKARSVTVDILYNGTRNLKDYLLDFSYTDNFDKTDDISITLADRDKLWTSSWFPQSGDKVQVTIKVMNWNYIGDNRELNLGSFEVDQVQFSDVVTINAVAVPITSNIRSEKKSKAWENVTFKSICSDISSNANLTLIYESDYNPFYTRKDQDKQSDLLFIEELAKESGFCVKVSNDSLIIFDEYKYDVASATTTITKGESNIVGFPTFTRNARNIYKACEINLYNSKKDKSYKGYFETSDFTYSTTILRIDENSNDEVDESTLNRRAKSRLREVNKKEWTFDCSLVGDLIYFTGNNINVVGFNNFDGKYAIENVSYRVGSGFGVDISCRKCLNY